MQIPPEGPEWDFEPVISLLRILSLRHPEPKKPAPPDTEAQDGTYDNADLGDLGDFSLVWDYLGRPRTLENKNHSYASPVEVTDAVVTELDACNKGVRWRDELDGADLEDNVEPESQLTASQKRTQKRAERRARAKERTGKRVNLSTSDTVTDAESGEELEALRRSPDRAAVIAEIIGRPRPATKDASSPPTSPSPPKSELRILKREWAISSPFSWQKPVVSSLSNRTRILPVDGLSARARKAVLLRMLSTNFNDERKYLKNPGLMEPAFTKMNKSDIGIHVFIDISNIMIGFHDCLKLARNISRDTRIRRLPMSFHNFSLVLERGRPAAKRVLAGSDRFPIVQQAKDIGYETNILERVHKPPKGSTPRQRKSRSGAASSGMETSGSETNTVAGPAKWVEQAVDEILHLKILESLIDADTPGTIVLATGDAADAEYSGGFMRMVERALEKGWVVELVSFKLNTSSAYRRKEFTSKWGVMFKWIQLDDYAEQLMSGEEEEDF